MEPLHAVFDSYKLDDLDRTWIDQVYESGFSNIENVPVNYLIFLESVDTMDLLRDTCTVVKNWMSQNHGVRINDREEVSWETLIAMNLEVRALLSVLAYLIKQGQTFDASQESRLACLRATSLYFVLLAIPGSNVFEAFQPNLYEIALKSLELSRCITPRENSSKKLSSEQLDDSTNQEDDTEFCSVLSKSQIAALTNGLNALMYDLVVMLKSTCTTMEIRSLELTVYYLVEMTKLANEPINFQRISGAQTSPVAYNAYVALETLCDRKYAPIETIARIIGKYTLPQFLVSSANLPAKQIGIIRESTLYLFKNLLSTHGKEAQSALDILIQHTMIKCPDRLDGRQKQAAVIMKLLNLSYEDEESLKYFIRDLVRLSHHAKISLRIFAQEIISKFIGELSLFKNNHRGDNYEILSANKIEEILLVSVLGRCVDVSSMVRGRAIATLAEYTESIERAEVLKIFRNLEDDAPREMASLERLEEFIEGKNVGSLLPHSDEIVAMLKNRLKDERALVRKSALRVLSNGIRVSPELLETVVPIICEHCRDAVLTVRRYAIHVLTNLLETFPDTPGLCEDWVDSVVPRIFDSEAKVQEESFNSLEMLTIEKITDYKLDNEPNVLPWKILNQIAVNEMGDHLSRACAAWIEGNKLTEKNIAIVKTHIGTCNDTGAWLLLASISENKKLSNMETYYTFYGRTLVESAGENVFLASLALRVLKNSWSTFDRATLQRISQDLHNCLSNYRIKVSLVRLCMEIVLDVTKELEKGASTETEDAEQDSEISRELVKLSESTITEMIESGQEELSDNLLFRAVCTLGHASFLSGIQISKPVRRILQRFLLEWSTLPDWVREKKELQGAAVVVLGQQAIIDRDIAVEMTPIFGCLLCNKRKYSGRRNDSRRPNNEHSKEQNSVDSCRPEDLPNEDNYDNMANDPVVRINAAKALADICVRFTSLVEPYLPDICISMKDSNSKVRQVILVIFIQLLVEDTIMIKDAFFFHILTMLTDEDTTIRQMTTFLVKERLLTKNKNLITQQLLNSVYHFNDYQRLSSLVNRRRKVRDHGVLSLSGDENGKKRRIIYDFMLENLDPAGKLAILSKLTRHILNPRSNDNLDVLCEKGISVIRDAIYIVSHEYLQPNSYSRQTVDDDIAEESGTSPANSVIVEAMKKHRNTILLPCLVELKRHCEYLKSPVLPEVAKYLVQTVADSSKDALTNLYNEYPKLEREIQLDSRKYCKRSYEESVEQADEEGETSYCETPKKATLEKHALLMNQDRMPRIVLRRLSTLTYPGTSGCSARTSETIRDVNLSKTLRIPNLSDKDSNGC